MLYQSNSMQHDLQLHESQLQQRAVGNFAQVLELIDTGGSEGGAHGRHWVLDPIDGTRGFVGLRQYAICLGMLDEGQVSTGALSMICF